MNKIILLLLFVFLLSCRNSKSELELKPEINNILNEWHLNASKANHDLYINAMAENAVYIGTDAKEYWTREEFRKWSKPHFDRKKTWNFKLVKRNIYFSENKNIAWFDELLETGLGLCRGSGVLEFNGEKWEINQYVLSPTIPNDIIGDIVKNKKSIDSTIVSEIKK